ncbi:MAG TPA: pyridoxal 5'-phosphate synthase [Pilimelia sp.]|nr:pyridoxal 5'-phosphate synthase [Pilimelia sp.]
MDIPPVIRDLLRGLPVLAGPLPAFTPESAPPDPEPLFRSWLRGAVAAGVAEPHATTLSTVDDAGLPDARIVILKELDAHGWQFAGAAGSAKGRQLARRPLAAMTFHWRELGRQVRVRGPVLPRDADTAAADFRARPLGARIAGLAGRQSDVLADPAALDRAQAAGRRLLADDPGAVAPGHRVYALRAVEVEFWQGSADRRHVRLRYRRAGDGWRRDRLWP